MGLFKTIISVGVGVGVTTLVAATGPVGLSIATAAKGVEVTAGLYAIASGVFVGSFTNSALNGVFSSKSGSNSSTSSSNQQSQSSKSGSNNTSNNSDDNSKDSYRDQDQDDSQDSSNESIDSEEASDEESWESSDEHDERNHRFKYIAKRYPGRSTYDKPLEIDHTIPMDVWKQLLTEIKKYSPNNLPKNLKRALDIFKIILKGKDIFSLSIKDLDKLAKEFPAIEILKIIHRHQFTTGSRELRKKFNKLILDFILAGDWVGAIEYIFRDQYNIAKFFKVDQREIENILNRQRSFVRYLLRKCVLTKEEFRKLLEIIDSLCR